MKTNLRESEERYRSIVDHLDIGVALIDGEHQILMANRALAALYQKPVDTLVGRRCFQEICYEGSICSLCPGLKALRTGQPAVLETTLSRHDGSRWYAHIRGVPFFLPEGSATGFVLVVVDITERKRMEERLAASEERLMLALDATMDGLWDYNIQTGQAYFSPRWETMLGYRPGEVEPHYRSWEKSLHPDDRNRATGILTEHLEGRMPNYSAEVRMRTKSGQWVWILARGQVVARDENGRALRMVGTHTDITERKMAEGEIHHLSRRLLGIAEEERERLARDLHDELGQVLTALQFGMETLKISLPEELEKAQALCQRNIELVAQLGESVRNFSTSLRPAMLDDLGLEAALDWHIRKFCRQRKDLEVDFQAGRLSGRLPREIEIGLYRICQESLTNIARHAGARHVRIRLSEGQGQVLLSIRDDGMGFDPKPARERGAGLLGMRERVAALGGNLEIISGSGKGTEIRVEVPLLLVERA